MRGKTQVFGSGLRLCPAPVLMARAHLAPNGLSMVCDAELIGM